MTDNQQQSNQPQTSPNTELQPSYTEQIAALLREVLHEPWMNEEEWQQVMAPFREMLDPDRIDAEVAAGIAAGFPFDVQLAALRLLFQEEEQKQGRG